MIEPHLSECLAEAGIKTVFTLREHKNINKNGIWLKLVKYFDSNR